MMMLYQSVNILLRCLHLRENCKNEGIFSILSWVGSYITSTYCIPVRFGKNRSESSGYELESYGSAHLYLIDNLDTLTSDRAYISKRGCFITCICYGRSPLFYATSFSTLVESFCSLFNAVSHHTRYSPRERCERSHTYQLRINLSFSM